VDAAIADGDEEWTQSMYRTLIGHNQGRPIEAVWTAADDAQEGGVASLGNATQRIAITSRSDRAALYGSALIAACAVGTPGR
jgi:hypothetical protein